MVFAIYLLLFDASTYLKQSPDRPFRWSTGFSCPACSHRRHQIVCLGCSSFLRLYRNLCQPIRDGPGINYHQVMHGPSMPRPATHAYRAIFLAISMCVWRATPITSLGRSSTDASRIWHVKAIQCFRLGGCCVDNNWAHKYICSIDFVGLANTVVRRCRCIHGYDYTGSVWNSCDGFCYSMVNSYRYRHISVTLRYELKRVNH